MAWDPLRGVETPEQALFVLAVIGGFSILLFTVIFVFVLYRLKLIVPKSRLFDDDYVQASLRNTGRLLRLSHIALGICILLVLAQAALYRLGVVAVLFSPLFCIALVLAVLFGLISFGTGRHKPSVAGTARQIAAARRQHAVHAAAPPDRKRKAYWVVPLLLAAMLAVAFFFSLLRGMGKLGVALHCAMLLAGVAGMAAVLPQFIRALRNARGLRRLREAGWTTAVLFMLVLCTCVLVEGVQDLPAQPVTGQMEVLSFTANRFVVRDVESGERIVMRTNWVERRVVLEELWSAWKASRAFYGDTLMRATHPDAADQPVYCTITYYPHTRFRVSVEHVVVGDVPTAGV